MSRLVFLLCTLSCCALFSGCAALTNPVANGVPARLLPDELLADSKEGFETIPLTLLRKPPLGEYKLAAGDTLGIFIEGVLGDEETPPPVNIPDAPELPLSIGYPYPVGYDGTLSLPFIDPVNVAGMTIDEAEDAVVDAYRKAEILRPEDRRILVTLMRPRYIRVLVIRDDSQQRQVSLQTESLLGLGTTRTQIGGRREGLGLALDLTAYENDVLTALTRTGGLPGLESTQEVIIQRGYWDPNERRLRTPDARPTSARMRTPSGGSFASPCAPAAECRSALRQKILSSTTAISSWCVRENRSSTTPAVYCLRMKCRFPTIMT